MCLESEARPEKGRKCACASGPRPSPRGGEWSMCSDYKDRPRRGGAVRKCRKSEARPQKVGKCACATVPRPAPEEAGTECERSGVAQAIRPSSPRSISGTQAAEDLVLGPMTYAFGFVSSTTVLESPGGGVWKLNESRGRKSALFWGLFRGRGDWRSPFADGGGRGWVALPARGACWVL